jgi:hypothetical protein
VKNNLSELQIRRLRVEAPLIDIQIKNLKRHLIFLSNEIDKVDPQNLLKITNESKIMTKNLYEKYTKIISPLGFINHTKPSAAMFDINSASRAMLNSLNDFDRAVTKLDSAAWKSMNKPGRWGDLSITSSITDLMSSILSLVEIFNLEKTKQMMHFKQLKPLQPK